MDITLCDAESAVLFQLDEEVGRVRQVALDLLSNHAQSIQQSELIRSIFLDAFDRQGVCRVSATLPVSIAHCIRGNVGLSDRKLAAALTVLEAGIYTLDHIMDREVEGPISELPQGALLLGAVSMIAHLPYQIILAGSEVEDAALLARTLANGLGLIASGQLADVTAEATQDRILRTIHDAVVMKTGERRALYATLAALNSGAGDEQVQAYAMFGRSLGVARQLRSDLQDLFAAGRSRDLTNGTSTFPVALLLEKTKGPAGEDVRLLLARATQDPEVHEAIRSHMRSFGVLRDVLSVIEKSCRNARAAIAAARPNAEAASILHGFLLDVSFSESRALTAD